MLGLTLAALMFGFIAIALDQAGIEKPMLVWIFSILAIVAGLGALAAFLESRVGEVQERGSRRFGDIHGLWAVP
jgi:hypothetical protein